VVVTAGNTTLSHSDDFSLYITANTHINSSSFTLSEQSGQCGNRNVKPVCILMKQEMMRWQWHQLDHMQIICTLLQTYNHAGTLSLNFHRPDALPDSQPTASEHQRQFALITGKC